MAIVISKGGAWLKYLSRRIGKTVMSRCITVRAVFLLALLLLSACDDSGYIGDEDSLENKSPADSGEE